MLELSLEAEFEIYKLIHKTAILQAKLTAYYKTIQESGVTIPFFMLESPEKKQKKKYKTYYVKTQKLLKYCIKKLGNNTGNIAYRRKYELLTRNDV